MHIFRFWGSSGPRLGLQLEGRHFDLSATAPHFQDLGTWLALSKPVDAVHEVLHDCERFPAPESLALLPPIDFQEVWASGVTYLRSKVARMEESKDSADIYDLVYSAERPELFFKALPARVSGHGMPIRIRRDSNWNVPEPELVIVLSSRGDIVGYTICNDMSSRSIEGENPLYLPQAKIYEGSCAIGPMIELNDGTSKARTIRISIDRDGRTAFEGEISTSQMHRKPEDLAGWLFRELRFPAGVLLSTGTGIVPPSSFSLMTGDVVLISIDGIGTLRNQVA